MITPPVAETVRAEPEGEDPKALVTPMEVVVTPEATVTLTIATVPFEMIVLFIPETTQV